MKNKEKLIDIDYIGGEGSLTIEEEKALSAFFKQRKIVVKKTKTIPPKNIKNKSIAK
jgi:hypothetical protein